MSTTVVVILALFVGPPRDAVNATVVGPAVADADGVLVHAIRSPYQAGTTRLRVLLPDRRVVEERFPVVFVLPVEPRDETRYGDGLREVRTLGLHNRLRVVFVAPTFSHLPWYADHPTRADVRQETYFLRAVVPFVDRTYPVRTDAGGRLLLGFSKSGWGAFSLLLRHPNCFGRAAAWDAPLLMDRPGPYGSGDVFATIENFAAYRVDRLLATRADRLGGENRLLLLGYGNFREHHQKAHQLMAGLKIAHEYRDGPQRRHDWHSGWVSEAVTRLRAAPEGRPR